VDPLFLSSPLLVAVKLAEMFSSGEIWPHILVSMQEAGLGFGLAIVTGIPLGIAMGRMPLLRYTLEPFIMAKYSSPTVAFLPLLIIWLGIGLWSKVALIFLGAVFVLIINTEAGVASVDRRLIETAKSFTANERQILTKIILPATLPFVLAGMRLAIGRVLIMVVVAELYASTAGLGHLVFQAGAMYDTTLVFVGVIILALAGIALSEFLRAIERRVAPWLQTHEG
jgi:ABC-type nitrate/sulfonate/bicarbonate transport system permease component